MQNIPRGCVVDMVDKRFGRLIVIKRNGSIGKLAAWLVKCDCGKLITVAGAHLRNGNTKSCGCLKIDTAIYAGKCNITHGDRFTKFYKIWGGMRDRCGKVKNYLNIYRCSRWKKYENFKKDMYTSYLIHCAVFGIRNTTLDRIDGTKGYFPINCRWATYTIQNRNRRNVKDIL